MAQFPKNIRKILVYRLGGLGDYILALSFFEKLRRLYPGAEISALAAPAAKELLVSAQAVDRLILTRSLHIPGLSGLLSGSSLSDLIRIRAKIDPPYDLFIDLTSKYSPTGWMKPLLFHFLCRPRFSVGLNCHSKGWFLNASIPEIRNAREHLILRYGKIIKFLGGDGEFQMGRISVPAEFLLKAETFFRKALGSEKGGLKIGLHPGANAGDFQARAWPLEHFGSLIEKIAASQNAQFFISASHDEEGLFQSLKARASRPIQRLPACRSVLELSAYFTKLDFFISNDTGPMHLAVCLGRPTLGIFGYSDYAAYGSYPPEIPFLGVTLEKTSVKKSRQDPRRLRQITVDEVYSKFVELRTRLENQIDPAR